ncbi:MULTISPECIES: hypothetical protein [unclassified Mesorhizobium]|uniref:hypothetical protein n=1 Tax=unclassified Mesorhizobium TaxID=325217 RepID=UPI000AC1C9AE|nr:hypothetical protein [Mesorhizobium sp. L2C066B000]
MADEIAGGGVAPASQTLWARFRNWVWQAIEDVPALRYALLACTIAAVIAFAAAFLDARIALVGIPILLVLMVALFLFDRLTYAIGIHWAASVLMWSGVILMIVAIPAFAVTFFVRPDILHGWGFNSFYEMFGIEPSDTVKKRNAGQYIAAFDDAVGGAAAPEAVAAAIERTAAFWRQPEQREILRKYRCSDPASKIIFEKSAEFVLADISLMKDVDTVTRYYDSVARCVLRGECDPAEVCGYFYQQMDDFQRQYTRYFHEIRILEGRDSIANVRTLLFKACQKRDTSPASPEELKCEETPQ